MVAVDVGGTVTDVLAVQNGEIRAARWSADYADVTRSVLRGASIVGARRLRAQLGTLTSNIPTI
jgi:N-methylhydantoinase A